MISTLYRTFLRIIFRYSTNIRSIGVKIHSRIITPIENGKHKFYGFILRYKMRYGAKQRKYQSNRGNMQISRITLLQIKNSMVLFLEKIWISRGHKSKMGVETDISAFIAGTKWNLKFSGYSQPKCKNKHYQTTLSIFFNTTRYSLAYTFNTEVYDRISIKARATRTVDFFLRKKEMRVYTTWVIKAPS